MKHDRFHIDYAYLPGKRIALRHDGQTIRVVRDNGSADYFARVEEERLRLAQAQRRPCLTCGAEFPSLGPHNRMCDGCRGKG